MPTFVPLIEIKSESGKNFCPVQLDNGPVMAIVADSEEEAVKIGHQRFPDQRVKIVSQGKYAREFAFLRIVRFLSGIIESLKKPSG